MTAIQKENRLIAKHRLGIQLADEDGRARHTRRIVDAIRKEIAAGASGWER